jgi:hypothetical protein
MFYDVDTCFRDEQCEGLDCKITVSISKDITTGFKEYNIPFSKVGDLVKSDFNYSAGTFKDGYRKKDNYNNYSNVIILDVDDGLPIDEAHQIFLPYNHFIATTKSHQKEKNGVVCDRYRVFLPTETPIDLNSEEYSVVMSEIMKEFNFVDKACKDSARFYYPAKDSIVTYKYGFTNFIWQDFYNKAEIEKENTKRLNEFNQNFKDKTPIVARENIYNDFTQTKTEYLKSIQKSEKLLELLKFKERFYSGGRNNYLYAIGCYLKDNGLSDEEVKDNLLWVNAQGDGIRENELRGTVFRSLKV